jgi:hypothetical protein
MMGSRKVIWHHIRNKPRDIFRAVNERRYVSIGILRPQAPNRNLLEDYFRDTRSSEQEVGQDKIGV